MAKFRDSGFAKVRRGIVEHLQDGRIGPMEFSVYLLLILQADPETGVWHGSAGLLAAWCSMSPRTCRDSLEKLEQKGYIKRFHAKGKHASYPILIHRYECTDGAGKGTYLNAVDSSSYMDLKYERCRDGAGERAGKRAGKYLEKKRSREKNKDLPQDKPAVDSRFTIFKDILERYWRFANTTLPEMPWSGREAKALSDLLSASPTLDAGAFLKLVNNRRLSEVNHSDPVYLWIRDVVKYRQPIDRFGKPLGGGTSGTSGSNPINRAQARTDGNIQAAKRALEGLYGDDDSARGEAQGDVIECNPSGLLNHAGPVRPGGSERGS